MTCFYYQHVQKSGTARCIWLDQFDGAMMNVV
ncbi:hypothetical protein KCQ_02465 [Pectobacterium atrosepticum ICMP 1526]|nr:hypothetical protein KCQ_02465 [Pectobacterium atrosepticum ICMP 1526]